MLNASWPKELQQLIAVSGLQRMLSALVRLEQHASAHGQAGPERHDRGRQEDPAEGLLAIGLPHFDPSYVSRRDGDGNAIAGSARARTGLVTPREKEVIRPSEDTVPDHPRGLEDTLTIPEHEPDAVRLLPGTDAGLETLRLAPFRAGRKRCEQHDQDQGLGRLPTASISRHA